jgi:hypothetical protein
MKKKRRGKHFKNILKTKNKLACNPDFKLPVVLSAPRSAFLAYFQPPGASKSLPGLKSEKNTKTNITTNGVMWVYVYMDDVMVPNTDVQNRTCSLMFANAVVRQEI